MSATFVRSAHRGRATTSRLLVGMALGVLGLAVILDLTCGRRVQLVEPRGAATAALLESGGVAEATHRPVGQPFRALLWRRASAAPSHSNSGVQLLPLDAGRPLQTRTVWAAAFIVAGLLSMAAILPIVRRP